MHISSRCCGHCRQPVARKGKRGRQYSEHTLDFLLISYVKSSVKPFSLISEHISHRCSHWKQTCCKMQAVVDLNQNHHHGSAGVETSCKCQNFTQNYKLHCSYPVIWWVVECVYTNFAQYQIFKTGGKKRKKKEAKIPPRNNTVMLFGFKYLQTMKYIALFLRSLSIYQQP